MKKFIFALLSIFLASIALGAQGEESDQKINDFNLAGFGDRGKKTWEISGKSADIFDDIIKLTSIVAKVYGQEEDIDLTSDSGSFNKEKAKVHLQDNVVITTTSGTRMTTDSLDWDRDKELVTTNDPVDITRGNLRATAKGATGQPTLKQVSLEKEVKVEITPDEKQKNSASGIKNKITVTCDGPMDVDYDKNVAVFKNNVIVDDSQSKIYSDVMDLYFETTKETPVKAKEGSSVMGSGMMGQIDKIIARGHVRIVRGENSSFSDEAIYEAKTKKITLTGKPKLVIYSTEGLGNATP